MHDALRIPGCHIGTGVVHADLRGSFIKIASSDWRDLPMSGFRVAECFLNHSRKGVVRGLHVQLPPAEHDKIISCISGRVFDVLVDLRRGSPLYGQPVTFVLDATTPVCVFIPAGVAHGFQAMRDETSMLYLTTTPHRPELDSGVHWQSCKIEWPLDAMTLSTRDQQLPDLGTFDSPFHLPAAK